MSTLLDNAMLLGSARANKKPGREGRVLVTPDVSLEAPSVRLHYGQTWMRRKRHS